MAITPAKHKALELEKEIPDWLEDLSSHLMSKDRLLRSKSAKIEYFTTLYKSFARHSIGDLEYVKFINDISGTVKQKLLNHDEDDDFVEDPNLNIHQDNVSVKYEPESDYSTPEPPTENVWKRNVSFEANVSVEPDNAGACVNALSRVKPKGVSKSAPKELTWVAVPNPTAKRVKVDSRNQNGRGVSVVNSEHHNEVEAQIRGRNDNGTDTPIIGMVKVKEEVDDDYVDPPDRKMPVENQVTNVEQWWHSNMVDTKKRREFREKVTAILEKPYCEEEYQRLLQDISDRKRVQHHRDLRGRLKIYEEDRLGKSFLDHHTDLAKRIASVQDDRPRVLNLLRGFFYWLTNLSHEGAFQPWRDLLCSEVLPATLVRRDHCI